MHIMIFHILIRFLSWFVIIFILHWPYHCSAFCNENESHLVSFASMQLKYRWKYVCTHQHGLPPPPPPPSSFGSIQWKSVIQREVHLSFFFLESWGYVRNSFFVVYVVPVPRFQNYWHHSYTGWQKWKVWSCGTKCALACEIGGRVVGSGGCHEGIGRGWQWGKA